MSAKSLSLVREIILSLLWQFGTHSFVVFKEFKAAEDAKSLFCITLHRPNALAVPMSRICCLLGQ
jgi:hypothetical protein